MQKKSVELVHIGEQIFGPLVVDHPILSGLHPTRCTIKQLCAEMVFQRLNLT